MDPALRGTLDSAPYGLLRARESELLFRLARDQFRDQGAVVDAGSFLGRSAFLLAQGLQARGVATMTAVQCYDMFRVLDDETRRMLSSHLGIDRQVGDSTRDLFEAAVAPVRSSLTVHEGDFTHQTWADGPIEILLVDIAKTVPLQCTLFREFVPSMIPGASWLIHQDYHHPWLPHLHVAMEWMSDSFEMVEPKVDDSALFRLAQPMTEDDLAKVASYAFTPSEQLDLMGRAIERLPTDQRSFVGLARVVLIGQLQGAVAMQAALEDLLEDSAVGMADEQWPVYLEQVMRAIEGNELSAGWRALDGDEPEIARAIATRVLERRLGTEALLLEVRACLRLGSLDAADRSLDRLEAHAPHQPEIALFRAQRAFDAGDLAGAEELAWRHLETLPESSQLEAAWWELCGRAWLGMGRVEEGEGALERFLQRHPDRVEARVFAARVRRSRGDLLGALRQLDEALQVQPAHPAAAAQRREWQAEVGETT